MKNKNTIYGRDRPVFVLFLFQVATHNGISRKAPTKATGPAAKQHWRLPPIHLWLIKSFAALVQHYFFALLSILNHINFFCRVPVCTTSSFLRFIIKIWHGAAI